MRWDPLKQDPLRLGARDRERSQIFRSACLFPLLFGRSVHPRFGIDSQSIGDAVDVVEVADHLRRHRDLFVVDPGVAQSIQVSRRHGGRFERQQDGELT